MSLEAINSPGMWYEAMNLSGGRGKLANIFSLPFGYDVDVGGPVRMQWVPRREKRRATLHLGTGVFLVTCDSSVSRHAQLSSTSKTGLGECASFTHLTTSKRCGHWLSFTVSDSAKRNAWICLTGEFLRFSKGIRPYVQ